MLKQRIMEAKMYQKLGMLTQVNPMGQPIITMAQGRVNSSQKLQENKEEEGRNLAWPSGTTMINSYPYALFMPKARSLAWFAGATWHDHA